MGASARLGNAKAQLDALSTVKGLLPEGAEPRAAAPSPCAYAGPVVPWVQALLAVHKSHIGVVDLALDVLTQVLFAAPSKVCAEHAGPAHMTAYWLGALTLGLHVHPCHRLA